MGHRAAGNCFTPVFVWVLVWGLFGVVSGSSWGSFGRFLGLFWGSFCKSGGGSFAGVLGKEVFLTCLLSFGAQNGRYWGCFSGSLGGLLGVVWWPFCLPWDTGQWAIASLLFFWVSVWGLFGIVSGWSGGLLVGFWACFGVLFESGGGACLPVRLVRKCSLPACCCLVIRC